ncbi:unnamed protein product [Gongylonema pulchrum]|uniref:Reverse transcriptase domain-containing protein n=1 Tax=Gongylonema pulchrum TaxID=637853 RepID=A0A183EM15_9BILA|nr:unnamed protein product [Gongylonema pulchrum]
MSSSGWLKGFGFHLGHQFYMDDLKLYTRSSRDLGRQIAVVTRVAAAAGMNINVGKSAQVHYDPRARQEADSEVGEGGEVDLPMLAPTEAYKYLGVEQRLLATDRAVERFEEANPRILKPLAKKKRGKYPHKVPSSYLAWFTRSLSCRSICIFF